MKTCPFCGNSRQVWVNQRTGLRTCHRAYCHTELEPDGDKWEAHPPDAPGLWWLICAEAEDSPDLVKVEGTENGLLATDPHIGKILVKDLDAGLIEPCWQKLVSSRRSTK